MTRDHSASTAWPDPRALVPSLDAGAAERFHGDDRHALRATLARAMRSDDMIVADGLPVGRVLPWGSVALYRPDPAAPLRHRVLELDPQGRITVVLDRAPGGELREAWVSLADGSAVGLIPGGAQHPLWGASDRLVHAAPGRAPEPLTVAGAVAWRAVDLIPPVAEPGRLPAGAGGALLNVLAALAHDQGRPALRYRGPFPTEQLFWSLTESFRFVGGPGRPRAVRGGRRGNVRARRVRGSGGRLAARAPRAAHPPGWARRPAPGRRRTHDLAGPRLPPARVPGAPATRAPRRARRGGRRAPALRRVARGARAGHRGPPDPRRAGGGTGAPLARARPARSWSLSPGRGARRSGRSCLSRRRRFSRGPSRRSGPGSPSGGDRFRAISSTRAGRRCGCRRSSRAPIGRGTGPREAGERRTLAQQLVREVLGLIGPAVRAAAAAWLEAMPATRQEAELDAAARRDRVALARAAARPRSAVSWTASSGAAGLTGVEPATESRPSSACAEAPGCRSARRRSSC